MEGIREEASEWVVRMAEDDASLEERRQFLRWLKRSPVHLEQFLHAEGVWSDLAAVDPQKRMDVSKLEREVQWEVADLRGVTARQSPQADYEAGAEDQVAVPAGRRAVAGQLAGSRRMGAGRIVVLAAAIAFVVVGVFALRTHLATNYVTGVGEQRTVRLEDGSTITLNTRSRVAVKFDDEAREIRLKEGEALFKVARDETRPFRVVSGRAVVQALGTEFLVRRGAMNTAVTVLEGRVSVTRASEPGSAQREPANGQGGAGPEPPERLVLDAGGRAEIEASGMRTRTLASTAPAVAWQNRRLMFAGESLADAVAEFNRYNQSQMVVRGESLSRERISGVFDVDRPEALIQFLQHAGAIQPPRRNGEIIVLQPPSSRREAVEGR